MNMAGELINMDGLGTALVYIADKIGITVAQMYDIYFRAQAAMAILQIVMVLVSVIVLVGVMAISYILLKKQKETDEATLVFVPLVLGIIAFVIVAVICMALYNPLLAYMCPEYTALKSLMYDITSVANLVR